MKLGWGLQRGSLASPNITSKPQASWRWQVSQEHTCSRDILAFLRGDLFKLGLLSIRNLQTGGPAYFNET